MRRAYPKPERGDAASSLFIAKANPKKPGTSERLRPKRGANEIHDVLARSG